MAFTTVFAGFALTTHILPKISLLPAFVAGLTRVLTMATPGMVNFPIFFTSLAAKAAKASSTFEQFDFFSSVVWAMASHMPPLDKALTPFIVFFTSLAAKEVKKT